MTHTPGPWTTEETMELQVSGERRPATYISATKGWANSGMGKQRTIAIVGHWSDRPNPQDDARLIAEAPELLKALQYAVKILKPLVSDDLEPVNIGAIQVMQRAIALATKES